MVGERVKVRTGPPELARRVHEPISLVRLTGFFSQFSGNVPKDAERPSSEKKNKNLCLTDVD